MPTSANPVRERKRYEKSVIKVHAQANDYTFAFPYQGPEPSNWHGSGFVINFKGQPYIITNAHVAANEDLLEVRIADGDKKYPAKVKVIDHHCDLAMLSVDDPDFWNNVIPLEIGDMPDLEDQLQVVGFPMGGKELCITKGTVSRNEVGKYCHSGVEFLHTQVSAEINPGNSGGPAIYEGKVLGVAFQGIMFGDGLGYIIPAPVLRHFIEDCISPGPYKGFPHLAFTYQNMENPYMREEYGLSQKDSGIRVKSVDPLSSAYNILKADDIILAIDGKKIKNDGTIDTDFSNRIHFLHLIREKSIGDSLGMTILRDGKLSEISVPLKHRCNQTKLAQDEWDKPPTYYIHSGIVFAPVTGHTTQHKAYKSKGKKQPGDEKVMLQSILPSEHTRCLDKSMERTIIKKVNGQKVRNMRDVIKSLEENNGRFHKIVTKGGGVFVCKRLSVEENAKILEAKRIAKPMSEDLRATPTYQPSCPEYYSFTPGYQAASMRATNHLEKEKDDPLNDPLNIVSHQPRLFA